MNEKKKNQDLNLQKTGRFTPATYNYDKLTEKEKKDIKKYGNPHKLGFLRVLMIVFGVFPISILFSAIVVTKNDIVVDVALIGNFFDAIIYTVLFCLIWQRKKAVKTVAIAALSVDILFTILDFATQTGLKINSDALELLILNIVGNGLLILYFAISRRVKYTCTRPLSDTAEHEKKKKTEYFNIKSWAFWRDLVIMFVIFSIVGHWMEFGYCTLIKIGILPGMVDPNNQIWSDFLFPFYIYGAGACACALIFYPVKLLFQKWTKNSVVTLILVFITSGIVCSLMELILGLTTNQDLQAWDYTNMFCNFMGQICLQNSIGFALAATIMTYIVYPLFKDLFAKLDKYMNWIFVGVVAFGIFLFAFYYLNYLPERLKEIDPDIYSDKVSTTYF